MTFLAIKANDLSSSNQSTGFKIYFSPLPNDVAYPTAWLDLHIGDDYYQDCEDDRVKKPFRSADGNGRKYVKIGPRKGIRLYTAESIGLNCDYTAVVTNTAGRAKSGLIVAPGKIDPGFSPRPLVLVVFNQAKRHQFLYAGDKIASVAFASLTESCQPTTSHGHIEGFISDFDLPLWDKIRARLSSFLYRDHGNSIAFLIISALLLLAQYLLLRYGFNMQ